MFATQQELCAFQMSSTMYCNRNLHHTGDHAHNFQFISTPEVLRLQRIQNDHLNAQLQRPPFIVEPTPPWVMWFVLLVGIVFGVVVAALMLLYPTP